MSDPQLIEALGNSKYAAAIKLLTAQLASEHDATSQEALLLDRAACCRALGLHRKALKV